MNLLKRFRSARTGQYVSRAQAHANQDTTVSETQDRIRFYTEDGTPLRTQQIQPGMTIAVTKHGLTDDTLILIVR